MSTPSGPPQAPRRPHVLRRVLDAGLGEGANDRVDERADDWYWLSDRDDPGVLAYLEAENAYTETSLASLQGLREQIFTEIKGRIRETDASAPVRRGNWEYFTRTVAGSEYAWRCRRPASVERGNPELPDPEAAPGTLPGEVVLLDENQLAAGQDYFALRGFELSPDQRRLAYLTDITGGERSTLCVRDLEQGIDLDDEVTDVYYGLAWLDDDTVLYVRPDDAMRPFEVWRHELGTATTADTLVLREDDERYYVGIGRTRSGRYVVIESGSKLTSEVHLVDTADPSAEPQLVLPRQEGIEYHVEHHVDATHGDRAFVLTNADGAVNFKLMVAPLPIGSADDLIETIGHRLDVRLEDVAAFEHHLVVSERVGGVERLRVLDLDDPNEANADHTIVTPEAVSSISLGANPEFSATTIRCSYTSMITPFTDLDYDVARRELREIKRQTVAGYDPADYETFREWAVAADGTKVPISVVRRRDLAASGPAPLLLYGYGSYEISIDPMFSVSRLSLLERGVAYAIAHVRGGGELGRPWYDDGKLDRKRNTFDDFVACGQHLVTAGLTTPDQLAAEGGSAGGLLMGAIANRAPELFRAVVAEVPFVDCLTTMLDPSLPLTVTEWEEWGDPLHDDAIYEYMKSYSPVDNVTAQDYPALLVTAGLNDPRVQYWEPAKWVAKLRATATGTAPLYLRTELGAGHHGPSGRYEAWREVAFVLAFILDQLGG